MTTYNHVLALQTNGVSAETQIHEGSVEELIEIVAKVDEETARKMKATEDRLAAIAEATSDPNKAVEYYRLQSAQAGLDEFLMRELENHTPEEQQKMVDEWHRTTSVGTMIIYHGYNYAGRGVPFTLTWPNFDWWPFDCNDAGSSVKTWGGNVLFEHSWYRGRRFYAIGTYLEYPDLRQAGFDNITSSYAAIG
ncbi:hypothetical protein SLUN_30020 [Streptomyces lunaelactis]|uniref:Uncharacterized protein n=1 Tax=Streptomyces lunaelactis TaxID=1535768 RepID=A0A2R4T9Q5_9ACTN|nr:hypothetical protein [Streptomyces lunaelactis]AVZ75814.1 hypothetical protein SLUN_30020 [Streptomyces lunaelactis]NUK84693.1 hypothetical protein [Streptomyces lunaelactis]NUL01840.1 hypothetical protein [Streptomyces lunaelactis]